PPEGSTPDSDDCRGTIGGRDTEGAASRSGGPASPAGSGDAERAALARSLSELGASIESIESALGEPSGGNEIRGSSGDDADKRSETVAIRPSTRSRQRKPWSSATNAAPATTAASPNISSHGDRDERGFRYRRGGTRRSSSSTTTTGGGGSC